LPVEFVASLTPREKEFCEKHLLADLSTAQENEETAGLSQCNIRQLRSRIQRKFLKFIKENSQTSDRLVIE
jgi:hypothetical protein